jgi:hypothetical protein
VIAHASRSDQKSMHFSVRLDFDFFFGGVSFFHCNTFFANTKTMLLIFNWECGLELVEKFVVGGNMGILCSSLVQTFFFKLKFWILTKPNNMD